MAGVVGNVAKPWDGGSGPLLLALQAAHCNQSNKTMARPESSEPASRPARAGSFTPEMSYPLDPVPQRGPFDCCDMVSNKGMVREEPFDAPARPSAFAPEMMYPLDPVPEGTGSGTGSSERRPAAVPSGEGLHRLASAVPGGAVRGTDEWGWEPGAFQPPTVEEVARASLVPCKVPRQQRQYLLEQVDAVARKRNEIDAAARKRNEVLL
ncbi:hypothetical protein T484DRAFT_1759673 [Baffinella frigidus]|nr:hypothetical protein T484DRAFT_1759673 [Cryptophyta sp. CCMP2293]